MVEFTKPHYFDHGLFEQRIEVNLLFCLNIPSFEKGSVQDCAKQIFMGFETYPEMSGILTGEPRFLDFECFAIVQSWTLGPEKRDGMVEFTKPSNFNHQLFEQRMIGDYSIVLPKPPFLYLMDLGQREKG